MRIIYILSFILALLVPVFVTAQTTTNPDISFIGDFRMDMDDANSIDKGKLRLNLHEIEIAANGYLNPYTRSDIFLAIHGPEATLEIEEAYITIVRGLPLGLQLKAGQYLIDFGKLNTQHPHQWSWVERPLMHTEMFGDDGLRDVAVNIDKQLPLGNSTLNVSANLLKGKISGHHHHDGEASEDEDSETETDLGISARVSLFSQIGEHTSVDFGVSFLRGENDPVENRYALMTDFDFKLKWKPDSYKSLTLLVEGLTNQRTVDDLTEASGECDVSSYGYFVSCDYQFFKRWNIGALGEYTQGVEDEEEYQAGYGAFAGFAVAEETTRFGLLLRHDDASDSEGWNTAMLQILWSLGPHKPHLF